MKIISKDFNTCYKTDNLFTKVKKYFNHGRFKLKTLLQDVFEKQKTPIEMEISMANKEYYPRKLPNSVSAKDEKFSVGTGGKIKFYKEDLEKMKSMNIDEKLEYTEKLIDEGKYDL